MAGKSMASGGIAPRTAARGALSALLCRGCLTSRSLRHKDVPWERSSRGCIMPLAALREALEKADPGLLPCLPIKADHALESRCEAKPTGSHRTAMPCDIAATLWSAHLARRRRKRLRQALAARPLLLAIGAVLGPRLLASPPCSIHLFNSNRTSLRKSCKLPACPRKPGSRLRQVLRT